MTKQDIFDELKYEDGDKLFIVKIGSDVMQRINVGFSLYELFGCCELVKTDLLAIMHGEVKAEIKEITRTKMENKEAAK